MTSSQFQCFQDVSLSKEFKQRVWAKIGAKKQKQAAVKRAVVLGCSGLMLFFLGLGLQWHRFEPKQADVAYVEAYSGYVDSDELAQWVAVH
jgi:hypothetical protein